MKKISKIIVMVLVVSFNSMAQLNDNGVYHLPDTSFHYHRYEKKEIKETVKLLRNMNKHLKSFRTSIKQYNFVNDNKNVIDNVWVNRIEKMSFMYYPELEIMYIKEMIALEKELSIDRDRHYPIYDENTVIKQMKTIRR